MKVETKKIMYFSIYILGFMASLLFLPNINTFRGMAIAGTFIAAFIFLSIVLYNKRILSPINIILACFILFQFGVPILYALDPDYTNWYVQQFQESSLIQNTYYSILCIETFAFGLIISNNKGKKKLFTSKFLSDDNSNVIYSFSKMLLLITGVIAIPLGIYVSYLGVKYGYNYVKTDQMQLYNGITRFAQEFYVAANLLCIVFSKNEKIKKFYMALALFYSIILIFSGARTVSLAIMLVLVFLKSEEDIKGKATRAILIIIGISLLAFVGAVVAEQRMTGSVENHTIVDVGESVVEEMGFNFTTINFVDSFVPSKYGFQYGLTYIKSIICLIPKTLDPTKTIEKIHQTSPELELADWLSIRYGKLYNFGVGYSVIAESYYNFGMYGFIIILIQGFIIGKIMNKSSDVQSTKFQKYVEYVFLYALLTYPRRSFSTLLKGIEYYIIVIIIAIFVLSQAKYRKKVS